MYINTLEYLGIWEYKAKFKRNYGFLIDLKREIANYVLKGSFKIIYKKNRIMY